MFGRRKKYEQELARVRMEAQLQSDLASAAMAQAAEQRRQYEARIADLKDQHELRVKETMRTIKALAEEVEFLRAQHFGTRTAQAPAREMPVMPEPDFMPAFRDNPHYLSEEEEDLAALRAGGHLDPMEHAAALAQLRAMVGPIQIEP